MNIYVYSSCLKPRTPQVRRDLQLRARLVALEVAQDRKDQQERGVAETRADHVPEFRRADKPEAYVFF